MTDEQKNPEAEEQEYEEPTLLDLEDVAGGAEESCGCFTGGSHTSGLA